MLKQVETHILRQRPVLRAKIINAMIGYVIVMCCGVAYLYEIHQREGMLWWNDFMTLPWEVIYARVVYQPYLPYYIAVLIVYVTYLAILFR